MVNFFVTTSVVMKKTHALALQMGHTDFSCSSGWFDHFKKKRNSVVYKSVHGESGTTDAATADN